MTLYIAGLALFLATHMIAWPKGLRAGLVARMGAMPFKGVYSLLAIAGFVMLVLGWPQARANAPVLYEGPVWAKHLALLLMPIAFVLLAAAYAPTGRIRAAVKHPMLTAVKVWALAHLLANGDLASVILFGGFLAWAAGDRISLARRERAGLIAAPVAGAQALMGDFAAIGAGFAASAVMILALHPLLFGVAVWPP